MKSYGVTIQMKSLQQYFYMVPLAVFIFGTLGNKRVRNAVFVFVWYHDLV